MLGDNRLEGCCQDSLVEIKLRKDRGVLLDDFFIRLTHPTVWCRARLLAVQLLFNLGQQPCVVCHWDHLIETDSKKKSQSRVLCTLGPHVSVEAGHRALIVDLTLWELLQNL